MDNSINLNRCSDNRTSVDATGLAKRGPQGQETCFSSDLSEANSALTPGSLTTGDLLTLMPERSLPRQDGLWQVHVGERHTEHGEKVLVFTAFDPRKRGCAAVVVAKGLPAFVREVDAAINLREAITAICCADDDLWTTSALRAWAGYRGFACVSKRSSDCPAADLAEQIGPDALGLYTAPATAYDTLARWRRQLGGSVIIRAADLAESLLPKVQAKGSKGSRDLHARGNAVRSVPWPEPPLDHVTVDPDLDAEFHSSVDDLVRLLRQH